MPLASCFLSLDTMSDIVLEDAPVPEAGTSGTSKSAHPGQVKNLYLYPADEYDRWSEFKSFNQDSEDLEERMAKYDIVHRWYQKPDWSSWCVTIRGEPLKILNEVMGDHLDIDTTWGVLDLDSPYQPIRDRREDLENYRATVKDPKRREIATLLITFFNTAISASPMSEFDSLVPYDELKDAFKPGDIVVMVSAGVTSAHYLREFYREPNKVEWIAVIECIDWNGSFFGFRSSRVEVPFYKGQEPITSLPICPIKCCKDRGSLEDRLVARGRKFEALRGYHYKYCDGLMTPDHSAGLAPRGGGVPVSQEVLGVCCSLFSFSFLQILLIIMCRFVGELWWMLMHFTSSRG